MNRKRLPLLIVPCLATLPLLAGCGSSSSSSSKPASSQQPAGQAAGGQGPGALSAEAQATATGDIPDTQRFLTYRDAVAGYSISYPEGWAQSGGANDVTIRDKNNLVHIVTVAGGPPTVAGVRADLEKARAATASLKPGAPQPVTLKAGPAVKVTYTTVSTPNSVTGKRVTLTVDRYVVAHAGKRLTLELGTPVGVDNVDAYRRMAQSLRWR